MKVYIKPTDDRSQWRILSYENHVDLGGHADAWEAFEIVNGHPGWELVCRFDGRPIPCFRHCYWSHDGTHDPNPGSICPADGAVKNRGTEWIIDIGCSNCDTTGSMRIDPAQIWWE
jgi:hypothetical protein